MKTALLNTVTKTKAENILSHWDILSNCLIETFRLTDEESVDLRKNKTAQLIAAIPFAAGCEEPLRTALAHLSIYMTTKMITKTSMQGSVFFLPSKAEIGTLSPMGLICWHSLWYRVISIVKNLMKYSTSTTL